MSELKEIYTVTVSSIILFSSLKIVCTHLDDQEVQKSNWPNSYKNYLLLNWKNYEITSWI